MKCGCIFTRVNVNIYVPPPPALVSTAALGTAAPPSEGKRRSDDVVFSALPTMDTPRAKGPSRVARLFTPIHRSPFTFMFMRIRSATRGGMHARVHTRVVFRTTRHIRLAVLREAV